MNKPLKLACIGCGVRAQTYTALAARRPDQFEIVAGADPVPARVEKIRRISGHSNFRGFGSAEELLTAGKIADVMIVATQDNDHFAHCTGALQLGYDVLLEKPIATRVEQVLAAPGPSGELSRDGLLRPAVRGLLPEGQGDHRVGHTWRNRLGAGQ